MDGEGAGKGDTPRPVDYKVYRENFDSIDWHRPKFYCGEPKVVIWNPDFEVKIRVK